MSAGSRKPTYGGRCDSRVKEVSHLSLLMKARYGTEASLRDSRKVSRPPRKSRGRELGSQGASTPVREQEANLCDSSSRRASYSKSSSSLLWRPLPLFFEEVFGDPFSNVNSTRVKRDDAPLNRSLPPCENAYSRRESDSVGHWFTMFILWI